MQEITGTKWIPKKDRDTAWYIFNEIFICNLRAYQMVSLEYVKTMGVNTSGDEESDKGAAMTVITCGLPISAMMEYFEKGIPVGVPNHADCKRIYELILDHLNAWAKIVRESFNPGIVPTKDLIALDKFAASVYPHAAQFFTVTSNRDLFAQAMFVKPLQITREPEKKKVIAQGHKSFINDFKNGPSQTVRAEVPRRPQPAYTLKTSNLSLNE